MSNPMVFGVNVFVEERNSVCVCVGGGGVAGALWRMCEQMGGRAAEKKKVQIAMIKPA